MTKFIVNGKQGYKTYHDWKAFWGMKGAPSTPPGPDPTEPFYMESRGEAMDVSIKKYNGSAPTVRVEYSFDKTTWQSLGSTSLTALTINVPAGGKVWLRASVNRWASSLGIYNCITSSSPSNVGGNIMSLLYGSNFTGDEISFPSSLAYIFTSLFSDGNKIVDASGLILPATTLTNHCYQGMFNYCQSLTSAPALPATTLASSCYYSMFQGCTSLTQAPVLPATTLANYCYQEIFYGCTSLTQAPALPATTLANGCYHSMFYGCTSLTQAPALPATTLAEYCYYSMFYDCISLTQAPALPATTLANYCYAYMFHNCGSLIQAPELPATTLVSGCYTNMFEWCSDLNYIKCLAVDDESYTYDFRTYCDNWVDGVNYSGTFIASDNYSQGWYWGMDGVPENWTTQTESGNYFEPTQEGGGGGGTQLYQSSGFTVYDMGREQGGYQVQPNESGDWIMEVPDFSNNDYCFAMMKISANISGWGSSIFMTPQLGSGVTAYVSYEVPDDGTCPFSYSYDDEYDYEYRLTSSDDGNQISPSTDYGNCRWVKLIKNQGTYASDLPNISMDF